MRIFCSCLTFRTLFCWTPYTFSVTPVVYDLSLKYVPILLLLFTVASWLDIICEYIVWHFLYINLTTLRQIRLLSLHALYTVMHCTSCWQMIQLTECMQCIAIISRYFSYLIFKLHERLYMQKYVVYFILAMKLITICTVDVLCMLRAILIEVSGYALHVKSNINGSQFNLFFPKLQCGKNSSLKAVIIQTDWPFVVKKFNDQHFQI